jgi:hypothetical protein
MASFPTTAPPSLNNWQLAINGVVLGVGSVYPLQSVEGLDMPNLVSGDTDRPRDTGEFKGLSYLRGRDIILTGQVNSDGTSVGHAVKALASAITPTADYAATEVPLWINHADLGYLCSMVSVQKRHMPYDVDYTANRFGSFIISAHATDPRLYGQLVNVTGTSSVAIVNSGTFETRPVITVNGPAAAGWTLTAPGAGYQGATGLLTVNQALSAGDTFTIDLDTRVCTYTHSAVSSNKRIALGPTPAWFKAPPGTTTLTLGNTGTTTGSTLAVQFCPAWIL